MADDTPNDPAARQGKLLETLLLGIPHPHQIQQIDLSHGADVRFTWRGTRYRLCTFGSSPRVEEVDGGVLVGSDVAILLERILQLVCAQRRSNLPVLPA